MDISTEYSRINSHARPDIPIWDLSFSFRMDLPRGTGTDKAAS